MTTPTREELLKLAKEAGLNTMPGHIEAWVGNLERFATLHAAALLQAQGEPTNPMDWPLPCDITVGAGTIKKGCKLSALVTRMNVLHDMAFEPKASEQLPGAVALLVSAGESPEDAKRLIDETASVSGAVDELPPLPVPEHDSWTKPGFTADQMREYATLSRAQATQPAQSVSVAGGEHPLDALLTDSEKALHDVIGTLQTKLIAMQESRAQWQKIAKTEAELRIAENAGNRALLSQPAAAPKLSVWYGPMPESNGKSNFTAILVRDGDICDGHTIDRSEYPEHVRYAADCVRYLIGELAEKPFILDYDADKHSGYVEPDAAPVSAPAPWNEAQHICDLPAVDDAIRNLLADHTGDNATCMVRAILEAAAPVSEQSEDSRDAARYRSAIASDDAAESLYAAVINNAGDAEAISAEFDAALAQAGKEPKQ